MGVILALVNKVNISCPLPFLPLVNNSHIDFCEVNDAHKLGLYQTP
jgi:hypothetical protein